MKKRIPLIVVFFAILSCKNLKTVNKHMYNSVPNEFNDIKMKVKGLDGWMPGRNIKYGGYKALKIKRGPTKGTGISLFPTINTTEDLHKKTSFTQIAPNGDKASIYITQKYSKKGINFDISKNMEFDNTTVTENSFLGEIVIEDTTIWNFIIQADSSIAKNLKGEEIAIEFTNYGCDFRINNKKVAGYATDVFIKNWTPFASYVWINSDISEDKKLVLASLITALIGRESINVSGNDE